LYSRSTAIDLLSPGRVRDSRRQHIQHQLDSLRFYDSVPLYDGLRRFTPATTTTTAAAPEPSTGHRRKNVFTNFVFNFKKHVFNV